MDSSQKNCLLVIFSQTRGYQLTQVSWLENFPLYTTCDIALIVSDTDEAKNNMNPEIENHFYKNATYSIRHNFFQIDIYFEHRRV